MNNKERFENLKNISSKVVELIINSEIPINNEEIDTLIQLIEINLNFYIGNQSRSSLKNL